MSLLRRPSLQIAAVIAVFIVLLGSNGATSQAQSTNLAADLEACFAFDRAACDRVLVNDPDNLTALFLRGLGAELEGDHRAALADFDAAATREPRHFGAQLWRHVAALTLGQSRATELRSYLDGTKQYQTSARMLAELYLGTATPTDVLASLPPTTGSSIRQPHSAESELRCAVEYHIGRLAYLAGRPDEARSHFLAALETGSDHVFEYQAAQRAVNGAN